MTLLALVVAMLAQVLTTQYDNLRTGATLAETTLTPANVNVRQFGKLFAFAVDGDVYAQPLYLPRVDIPGRGTHDVVFVATEHDTVYAFDAAGRPAAPLWQVSFLTPGVSGTVPAGDARCPFVSPEIGITPTPVIDRETGTLYVLARTRESAGFLHSRYVQRLHALAVTTGVEKFGGPIEVQAPGFEPLREMPRAGLLLASGRVVLTWASSCDVGPYHGWVMAYDARTLRQIAAFNTSPDAGQSGVWQSDNGPAADAHGNIYAVTGNGQFDAATGGRDYGDTILELAVDGPRIAVRDYFTPANQQMLNSRDLDIGSGGPVLLPDQPGDHPHLLVAGGKDASLYVVDRDAMGKYAPAGNGHPLQFFRLRGGLYAPVSYWNGHVYVLAANDALRDYPVRGGALSAEPVKMGTKTFPNPGAPLAISANGSRDAVLWLIETKVWNAWDRDKPSVLRAYAATDVTRELFNSEENAARDRAGMAVRFTIPTVANGRVYVPAKREVDVYGLLAR